MKLVLTLAIVLASSSAFATRARLTSLGNAAHLIDSAIVYGIPVTIFALPDSVTIESGRTDLTLGANGPTEGAEALVIRSSGDAKWALSLGHDDIRSFILRTNAVSASVGLISQQNPIEVTYGMRMGDMAWAATLGYSNFNNKAAEVKESTTVLKLSAGTMVWNATVDIGLTDKWEDSVNNDEFKGKSNVALRGGSWLSEVIYGYAEIALSGYKRTDAGVMDKDVKATDIIIGANNIIKNEDNEFFWGVAISSSQAKDSVTPETKLTSLSLPVIIGMEANAASWLTLRGSVNQNVLIQNSKTEAAATAISETAPGANSTVFAGGVGLKFGKLNLDGSILAGTQQINSNNLLGTVGLTYAF